MSTNSETKNNSDNPDSSSTNLGEQDKSEKVEVGDLILHKSKMDLFISSLQVSQHHMLSISQQVKWLHPDGKPNMEDDKNNDAVNENHSADNEKASSSSGASSFFASAWSAWGKVKPPTFSFMNITQNIFHNEN